MDINVASISPVPTEEEAAAVTAAVVLMWPQPAATSAVDPSPNVAWRFSGRWWATDAVSRRGRP